MQIWISWCKRVQSSSGEKGQKLYYHIEEGKEKATKIIMTHFNYGFIVFSMILMIMVLFWYIYKVYCYNFKVFIS